MEHQIIAAYAGVAATVVIGLGQLGMIGWGLWQMSQTSKDRSQQITQQGEALAKMGQGLERQTEALATLLRRPA